MKLRRSVCCARFQSASSTIAGTGFGETGSGKRIFAGDEPGILLPALNPIPVGHDAADPCAVSNQAIDPRNGALADVLALERGLARHDGGHEPPGGRGAVVRL